MYILPVLLIKYPLGEFSVPVSPSWKPCFLACVCIFFLFCFSILLASYGDFQIQANKTLHKSVCAALTLMCAALW